MKNLGEKLKAAREAMGMSVKDVAEVTRVRSDYIENMESGDFSFKLPEIYKRGFLRIYANSLKLDADALVAEFNAGMSGATIDEAKHKRILTRKQPTVPAEIIDHPSRYADDVQQENLGGKKDEPEADAMRQYLKLGGIFVGVLLSVVVLVSLISLIMRPAAPKENVDIAMGAAVNKPVQPPANADISAPPAAPNTKEFTLDISALGDTYVLVYHEDNKDAPLFSGGLEAGVKKSFTSKKPIMLKLTDAEKIRLERNGKPLPLGNAKGILPVRVNPI